jgi:hypothetical protein
LFFRLRLLSVPYLRPNRAKDSCVPSASGCVSTTPVSPCVCVAVDFLFSFPWVQSQALAQIRMSPSSCGAVRSCGGRSSGHRCLPLPAACRRRRPRAVPSFSPARRTVRVKKEGTKHLPGRGKGNTIPPRPWHRQHRRPPLPSFSGGAAQSTPLARLLTAGPHCASSGPLHLLPLCSTHIARPASTLPRRSSPCS